MSSFNAGLSDYITGQANATLSKSGLPSLASYSASASSSASSGPSKSGDISGGTAFNVGGINLGTQYESPATAGGGNPTAGIASTNVGGLPLTTIAVLAVIAIAAIIILRRT